MGKEKRPFRGRPTSAAKPGERSTVSLRLTAETRERIDKAAKAIGRPFSQEAELRLEKSFERQGLLADALELAHGREAAGLIFALGLLMTTVGRGAAYEKALTTRKQPQSWANDPYAFHQAVRAAVRFLRRARPSAPDFKRRADLDTFQPALYAAELLGAIKSDKKANWAQAVFEKSNISTIRALLGPMVDRLEQDEKNRLVHHRSEDSK